MHHEMKKSVYSPLQVQKHAGSTSAMLSVAGFIFARRAAHIPAAYQPRDLSVMGTSSACKGLDNGKWHAAFFVPQGLNLTQMKHANKTAEKTASTITFEADWLQFTEHLSNGTRHDFCNYYNRYIYGTSVGCVTHKPKGGGQ